MSTNPIVSPSWLHSQLTDRSSEAMVIVDCRFSLADPSLGQQQYQTAHIPDAHYLDLNRDLSSPVGKHGGRHPLPDPDTLGEKLAAIGVNTDTLVIIYDDSRFAFAARLWWLLRYYGHDRVAILDGGYRNWVDAGYPVTAATSAVPDRGNFAPHPQADWIVDIAGVQAIQNSPTHLLIDSREADRYLGKTEPIDPRAGHIPNAVNYPWQDVSNSTGFILPIDQQQQRWRSISPEVEPIVYCGSGVTACVNLLSLTIAGIDRAKLYPGSWSDWCSYIGFIPYSAIGTNLADVSKRRQEHDPTPLNLQLSWYLTPEAVAELDPEILTALSTDLQPIYGRLLTLDAQAVDKYRDRLPASLQAQIPSSWQLPRDIWGYAFFACPLPPVTTFNTEQATRGDRMVLNGDGMLYRLGFQEGAAILKTRMMKTPCYYADLAAQLLPKFDKIGYRFLDGGMVRHSLLLGTRNQMNTAFLATKEHLLVTFDAARPHIIDPDTLELLEPIGAASNWQGLAPKQPPAITQVFQPYSNPAHPVCDQVQSIDPQDASQSAGEFITANYSAGLSLLNIVDRFRRWLKARRNQQGRLLTNPWGAFTSLIRYRFDSKTFEKWRLVEPDGEPVIIEQAIHQMALTEDYIIVGDIAFKIELSQIFAPFLFGDIRKYSARIGYWLSIAFTKLVQPLPYANLYLVKRSDLDLPIPPHTTPTLTAIKITLPREVSHFVTDYRNPDGKITLLSAHNGGWDVTEWIGEYDESVNLDCEITPPVTRGIEMLAQVNQHLPPVPPVKCLNKNLRGMQPAPVDLNSMARYTIDANTGAILKANFLSDPGERPSKCNTWSVSVNTHRNLNRDSELETGEKITSLYWMGWGFSWETIPKRIYRAYAERENRVIPIEGLPQSDLPATLLRLDTERMEIVDSFEFPIGYLARSPQFIPSQEPCPPERDLATHGYIVCVIMSDADPTDRNSVAKDEFWVFHADDFKGKPIYRLSHPDINLGLTIHSTWIPEIQLGKYPPAARAAMREETLDRDYNPVVQAKLCPHTKDLFREVVYPHYINQTSEAELLKLWQK